MAKLTTKTVRMLRITLLLVAIICTLVFTPWSLLLAWLSPLPATVQQQVEDAVKLGLDGIIVYTDNEQQPTLYAAGWHNRQQQQVADPQAYFKIASISKLYIAAATVKLINQQRLALDNSLADLLPQLAAHIANADKISLRMLLQHRSGIANFTDHPDYPWPNLPDNQGALAFVLDQPANFEPDQQYQYSNTNYLLIGEIMDTTLGYSHHQYIHEAILQPLGLQHTFSLLSDVPINQVMSGYSVGYEPDIKSNDYTNPGGSMVATAGDVGMFLRALNNGTLLNEQEMAIYRSVYPMEHTGLLPGYSSIARYHQDIDTVVIQFVNTSGGVSWTMTEIVYQRIVKIISASQ